MEQRQTGWFRASRQRFGKRPLDTEWEVGFSTVIHQFASSGVSSNLTVRERHIKTGSARSLRNESPSIPIARR
jgi:hypothetical protein